MEDEVKVCEDRGSAEVPRSFFDGLDDEVRRNGQPVLELGQLRRLGQPLDDQLVQGQLGARTVRVWAEHRR